jgi:hypothetical protein
MVNLRTFNAITITSGSSPVGLNKAWGVLKGTTDASGSITLEGFGTGSSNQTGSITYATVKIEHLSQGMVFPCYVRSITVSSGTVYLLA